MKQNIYDNPDFFAGYAELRRSQRGLNEALEWPAFRTMLPPMADKRVLDLGCGFGKLCRQLREDGAKSVVGVDISTRMLEWARRDTNDPQITYLERAIEDADFASASFDLVTSSLALHYVERFDAVCANVARWLAAGGAFAFSVEHPTCTGTIQRDPWCHDERGARRHWIVDNYQDEGRREVNWIVDGVVKYHRKLETYLNALIAHGFAIARVLEPPPTPEALRARPDLELDRRRPPFLLVSATRV